MQQKCALVRDRPSLLHPNVKRDISSTHPLVYSTQYSVEYRDIYKIVHINMQILLLDPLLASTFKDGYGCVARRAPSLRNALSPSLFTSKSSNIHTWLTWLNLVKGSSCCGHQRCTCCTVIKQCAICNMWAILPSP